MHWSDALRRQRCPAHLTRRTAWLLLKPRRLNSTKQLHVRPPQEVFAKVQHNKQLLKATWQRRQGVRVFFNRAF